MIKKLLMSLCMIFLLIVSLVPLEAVTSDEINSYSNEVASFIKEKCNGNCENVILLGDDYIIPSFRRDIRHLLGWWFWERVNVDKILTDIGYVQRQSKTFSEFDDLFKVHADDHDYEGKNVLIIRPDEIDSVQNASINEFIDVLYNEGYNPDIEEKKSSEIVCNDPGLFSDFNGRTLFVFGTEENNYAYNCFPFQAGLENRDSAFIDVNPWDGRNYAVVVNTEDPEVIQAFTILIEDKGYQNLSSEAAHFFRVGVKTATYAVMGVSLALLVIGSGGTAAPIAIGAVAAVADGIVDGADAVDTCFVNYDGIGWCGVTLGFAILPFIPGGPVKQILKGLGDDAVEFFEKGLKRMLGSIDESIVKNFWKNMPDTFDDVRKTRVVHYVGKLDDAGTAAKNADEVIDEFTDAVKRQLPESNARGASQTIIKGGEYVENGRKIEFEAINSYTGNPVDIHVFDTDTFVEVKTMLGDSNINNIGSHLSDAAEQLKGLKAAGKGAEASLAIVGESQYTRQQIEDIAKQWIKDNPQEAAKFTKITIEGVGAPIIITS